MQISPQQKIILLDDEPYHLNYLVERLQELGVAEEQIELLDHPDDLPELQELKSPKLSIVSDAAHLYRKPDIDIALLNKLHKERDSLEDIDLRLGFRTSHISPIGSDNAVVGDYQSKAPQKLSPEMATQLDQQRSRLSSSRVFYEILAKDPNLRPNYVLMSKSGRQQHDGRPKEIRIQKDREALALLLHS